MLSIRGTIFIALSVNSFNTQSNLREISSNIMPFSQTKNCGTKRLRNLPRIIELVSGSAEMQAKAGFRAHARTHHRKQPD